METINKLDILESALLESCDKFIKKGGIIKSGLFVSTLNGKECRCPIGTLDSSDDLTTYSNRAYSNRISIFGINNQEMWAFVFGFDGHARSTVNKTVTDDTLVYYNLGKKFRKHYIEGDKQW